MSKPGKIIPDKTIGVQSLPTNTTFSDNDAILYSLGIGFSQGIFSVKQTHWNKPTSNTLMSSTKSSPVRYWLILAFPTMASVVNKFDLVSPFMGNPNFPEFSPFQILHAEQRL